MTIRSKAMGIIVRYLAILILSLFYPVLNAILFFPTAYISYGVISLFYSASISGNMISFNGAQIELIDACISGLAYLLLIVLNLAVEMPLKTRMKALSISLTAFFTFNILRISLLALLFSSGSQLFNYFHIFFWYFGSLIAVFLIWIFEVKTFKIKEDPFISDIKLLFKNIKN
ncbi:MAG: pacearchaeosortase [Nanoarchaeota archaeon]|nr:pacearchaeosortase [Nanoarchaeota archaeon]